MSRILRTLVCLLLICCILINCSPIKAKATMVTTAAIVSVSVLPVVAAVFVGLGVQQAAAVGSVALQPFVESCIAHLQELGLCQEMTIDIFGYTFNGYSVFGITPALIEAIRSWLFDNDVLVESPVLEGYAYYNGYLLPLFTDEGMAGNNNYRLIAYAPSDYANGDGDNYYFFAGKVPLVVNSNGDFYTETGGNWRWYSLSPDGTAWEYAKSGSGYTQVGYGVEILWSNHDIFYSDGGSLYLSGSDPSSVSSVDSSYDLELGVVAPQSQSLQEGYPTWYNNSTTLTDPNTQEQVAVLPIPQVNTYQDALSIPQQQIWQGSTTGTGSDTGTDSGGNSGTSPSGPVPDMLPYALDLTDFFPFCIPFDIYDFFSALIAEPEAPKFHWELQDLSGRTYTIDIDLSPWNGLAATFRSMQLLLFIVGLAVASRKFIKW